MNCPGCGRFMELEFAYKYGRDDELSYDLDIAAFWWVCNTNEDCPSNSIGVPAPEYDWLYWCIDIPEEDFEEDAELRQECEQMRQQYLNRSLSRIVTPQ